MTINLVKALVFLLIFSTALKVSAQDLQTVYGSYESPKTITIPAGKVLEIVSGDASYNLSGVSGSGFGVSNQSSFPIYIVGAGVLTTTGLGYLTYRVKENISTTTTIPTSAVVIPTDATGPVNVILESSTDLVTWTAANPGTYGASTTKRFFRVRAVNQ